MSLSSPTGSISPPPVYDTLSHSPSFSTNLRPYLQLPHLLSLAWLASPILSLIFVAFRLQLSLSGYKSAAEHVKDDLLASCRAAEHAATAAASLPRYLATSTNRQFAAAVNDSMEGARVALVLALTAMEGIINFLVDIYRSTFLCFAELVVRGGLAILIDAVQRLNTFVQNTASSIRTSIQSDIDSANSAIRSAFNALNKVNPFGNVNPPQFSIPSLSGLQNITIPTEFEDALISLNNTLPSFAELKEKVNALLDTPFELLKKDINDTFSGIRFDQSLLPVPDQNTLTFCDRMDTSVVDDLSRDIVKITEIGVIIILLLALLLVCANCAVEWYKWRCLKRHLERTRQAWVTDPTLYHIGPSNAPQISLTDHNLLMLQAASTHPLLMRIANYLSTRLNLSTTQYIHIRWFFHYVFHPPALACFLIGFFGLLSVQIQLIAVGPLEAKFDQRANSAISDFSGVIVSSVNNSMFNQSSFYASSVNSHVDNLQNTINNGVFGWVNGTTTTLNNTLNDFYTDVQNIVTVVFNGTVLENPALDFVRCIIGGKVNALEEALTFLHDNLVVNMPRINESVLVLSNAQVNEATKPIAEAALGGGRNNHEGFIGRLVNTYVESLKKERIMFAVFLALWFIVVLMAFAFIFSQSCGRRIVEVNGRRKWKKKQRSDFASIVVPYRQQTTTVTEKRPIGPPIFTPMPSPGLGQFTSDRRDVSEDGDTKAKHNWGDDVLLAPKSNTERTSMNISKPKKLMVVGRGSFGVEKFVGDANAQQKPAAGAQQGGSSWYARLRSIGHNKPPTQSMSENKARPVLRITTDGASINKLDPFPESSKLSEPPVSAWSVTPPANGLRVLPWTNIVTPNKKADNNDKNNNDRVPGQPKFRAVVSVPSSVNSIYEDHPVRVEKPYQRNPTPLAIPLHLGFDRGNSNVRPPPDQMRVVHQSSRSTLAPPPERHRRSSSVPAPFIVIDHCQADESSTSTTPVTRLLTTTHARHSSSVNPFSTPFDDEHAVYSNNKSIPFAL